MTRDRIIRVLRRILTRVDRSAGLVVSLLAGIVFGISGHGIDTPEGWLVGVPLCVLIDMADKART